MNTNEIKRFFVKKQSEMLQEPAVANDDMKKETPEEPKQAPNAQKRFVELAEIYILPALVLALVFIALILMLVMPDKKVAITMMITAIPFIVIVGMLQASNTAQLAESKGESERWQGQISILSYLFIIAAGLQLVVALIIALSNQKGVVLSAGILQLLVVGCVTAMYPLSLVEPAPVAPPPIHYTTQPHPRPSVAKQ